MNVQRSISCALAMFFLICVGAPAFAGIDTSFDWKGTKRKLKVWYNFDLVNDKLGPDKMKDLTDSAITNWNAAKADTGWEFDSSGSNVDHDIEVKVGALAKGKGGGSTTGFAGKDKNGELTKLTVTMDPNPADGFAWGANDDAKKNALSSIMHELSHTVRLDHQGGLRSKTSKIKDPQGSDLKDDDKIALSQDDKDEAKTASTAAIKLALAPVGPGQGALVAVEGYPEMLPFAVNTLNATLSINANTFNLNAQVGFSRGGEVSMPYPENTPLDVEHIVKSVLVTTYGVSQIFPTVDSNQTFQVTIPYEDGTEGEGYLIDIADPEWQRILEPTLRPFYFDPTSQSWYPLVGFSYSLDMLNDVATITVPAVFMNIFTTPSDPTTNNLWIGLSGMPVPEPGSVSTIAIGIVWLWRIRSRKNRPRHFAAK